MNSKNLQNETLSNRTEEGRREDQVKVEDLEHDFEFERAYMKRGRRNYPSTIACSRSRVAGLEAQHRLGEGKERESPCWGAGFRVV